MNEALRQLRDTQIAIHLTHGAKPETTEDKLEKLFNKLFVGIPVRRDLDASAYCPDRVSVCFGANYIWLYRDNDDTFQESLVDVNACLEFPSFAEFKRQIGVS